MRPRRPQLPEHRERQVRPALLPKQLQLREPLEQPVSQVLLEHLGHQAHQHQEPRAPRQEEPLLRLPLQLPKPS